MERMENYGPGISRADTRLFGTCAKSANNEQCHSVHVPDNWCSFVDCYVTAVWCFTEHKVPDEVPLTIKSLYAE